MTVKEACEILDDFCIDDNELGWEFYNVMTEEGKLEEAEKIMDVANDDNKNYLYYARAFGYDDEANQAMFNVAEELVKEGEEK